MGKVMGMWCSSAAELVLAAARRVMGEEGKTGCPTKSQHVCGKMERVFYT